MTPATRGALFALAVATFVAACGSDEGGTAGSGGTSTGGAGGSGAASGTGASGGSTASGGSGGGSAGAVATGGTAGSASGGSAGSASDGSVPLVCESGSETFQLVVSQTEQFKRIPLPLKPGVEYRRVTLAFDYVPTAWSGTCYNPASSKKVAFPKFESLISLKRGNHWCKGGNLFELTLQGPAPGYGASNKAIAQTFYKNQQHTGSGCGGSDVEAPIFNQTHAVSEGTKHSAKIVYDATLGTLDADVGPSTHSGTVSPLAKLVANGTEQWNVVLSFDGGFLECYDGQGQPDPTAPCCWGPSIGWVFENLSWEICY